MTARETEIPKLNPHYREKNTVWWDNNEKPKRRRRRRSTYKGVVTPEKKDSTPPEGLPDSIELRLF